MAEILRFTRDIYFDSALTKTIGAAFDGACRTFEKPPSVLLKKQMAEQILAKASAGERDYDRLVAYALKAASRTRFRREDP